MWPFGHCRCCKVRAEENERLWALLSSMRAVTIDPPPVREVVKEVFREVPPKPAPEQDQPVVFNRYTEREVFLDDEQEQ